jgi:hypothetical protein
MLNSTDAIALGYSQKELDGAAAGFYFLPSGSAQGSISIAHDGKVYGAAGRMGGSHLKAVGDIIPGTYVAVSGIFNAD